MLHAVILHFSQSTLILLKFAVIFLQPSLCSQYFRAISTELTLVLYSDLFAMCNQCVETSFCP